MLIFLLLFLYFFFIFWCIIKSKVAEFVPSLTEEWAWFTVKVCKVYFITNLHVIYTPHTCWRISYIHMYNSTHKSRTVSQILWSLSLSKIRALVQLLQISPVHMCQQPHPVYIPVKTTPVKYNVPAYPWLRVVYIFSGDTVMAVQRKRLYSVWIGLCLTPNTMPGERVLPGCQSTEPWAWVPCAQSTSWLSQTHLETCTNMCLLAVSAHRYTNCLQMPHWLGQFTFML